MGWFAVVSNLARRVPIEKVLFPPRDKTRSLEEFAATMTAPVAKNMPPPEQIAAPTITQVQEPVLPQEDIATACVPCALGHFSTSAGLLNETVRFKNEGMTSNEVLDRIAKTLQEQNTLERVDLTPEKMRNTPDWEREMAEDALQQSRSLRHRLETIQTFEELEVAAADTARYYRRLNRAWFKRRLALTGEPKPEMSLEDAKKLAAEEAANEVEREWPSPENK